MRPEGPRASGSIARSLPKSKPDFSRSDLLQLLPGIFDGPAEKGLRLPVESREDLFQERLVLRVAVGLRPRQAPAGGLLLGGDGG